MKQIFAIFLALSLRETFHDSGYAPSLIEVIELIIKKQYCDADKYLKWVKNLQQYKVSNLAILIFLMHYIKYVFYACLILHLLCYSWNSAICIVPYSIQYMWNTSNVL